jgi:archaellum component FlaC
VAVATSEWDAERLGKFYKSIATKIEVLTPEIQRFKDDAEEH